ncbi:dehydrogenase/reductase SDR family member 4 [Euwallacea similis]|uniref:dehydrogenase/reductase SDR family member 4 n=1 Tax=Euwallacea similis TaxID=1736056 RepID=UPI00344C38CB
MSLKRLGGRVAIVTASTDGIGFSIAQRLAREGAKVIVSSRKAKNVEDATQKLTNEGLEVTGLVCHVSNAEDRKKLFNQAKKLGGLDILVSNAGVNPEMGGVLDCSESSWDKIFDVNVKSSFLLAKEALPLLRQSKVGRIIFISSIAGLQPMNALGAYSVSKTALLGLVKAASMQLASEGITVNAVCPGIIATKFSSVITDDGVKDISLAQIPLGRFGKSEDIGASVAYLASDDGTYVTGENLVVAGGMISRL